MNNSNEFDGWKYMGVEIVPSDIDDYRPVEECHTWEDDFIPLENTWWPE